MNMRDNNIYSKLTQITLREFADRCSILVYIRILGRKYLHGYVRNSGR